MNNKILPIALMAISLSLGACGGSGGDGQPGVDANAGANIEEDEQLDNEAEKIIEPENILPEGMAIHPGGRVLSLKVDRASIDDRDGLSSNELQLLSQHIYTYLDDSFDFIFFVSPFTSENMPSTLKYSGRYSSVRSFEQGLGWATYDSSADYGSAGQLQGVMHLAKKDALRFGPSLHELAHRWANFALPSRYYSHWSFAGVDAEQGGQLGGFAQNSLLDLGNNRYQANAGLGKNSFGEFANGGNGLPYAAYELYLMGLAPASELVDYQYFDDAQWSNPATGEFTSEAGVKTLKVNEVISTLGGPRQPAYGQAQNSFRVLTVLLYSDAAELALVDQLDDDIRLFSLPGSDGSSTLYNFYEATKGRASLNAGSLEGTLK
ncbi:MAG: hypothetical protein HRU20_05960 [Pseudomonadales bacterium]|nr:hypothetical protein [Pseudomonadales bacterium]